MIETLEIRNMQSHKHTILHFSEGVNVIVGSTDCGKTAIIRALDLVINNQPAGDGFISWWADTCRVTLTLLKGVQIVRERGKGVNKYMLGDTVFTAFGQDVPNEIAKVLNITDVNFQAQLDSPFLFTLTPGQVAAYFNKIAHLSNIEKSTSYIKSQISKVNASIEIKKTTLEAKQLQQQDFIHVPKIEACIEVMEDAEREITRKRKARVEISALLLQLEKENTIIQELSDLLTCDILVKRIEMLQDKKIAVLRNCASLERLVESLQEVETHLLKARTQIKCEKIVRKAVEKSEAVENVKKQQQSLQQSIQALTQLEMSIRNTAKLVNSVQFVQPLVDAFNFHAKKVKELHEFTSLLDAHTSILQVQEEAKSQMRFLQKKFNTDMPQICPLCGSKEVHQH